VLAVQSLSDSKFEALLEVFNRSEGGISAARIRRDAGAILGPGAEGVERVDSLFAWAGTSASRELSAADAAAAAVTDLPTADASDAAALQERLERLLASPDLRLFGLTLRSLIRDDMFSGAEVMTDIRPVFDAESARTGIVIHRLNFSIRGADGAVTPVSVSLDDEDVEVLIGVLESAKQRAQTLSELFQSKGLPLVDIGLVAEEDDG
jgi:hypothetical protein